MSGFAHLMATGQKSLLYLRRLDVPHRCVRSHRPRVPPPIVIKRRRVVDTIGGGGGRRRRLAVVVRFFCRLNRFRPRQIARSRLSVIVSYATRVRKNYHDRYTTYVGMTKTLYNIKITYEYKTPYPQEGRRIKLKNDFSFYYVINMITETIF